MNRSKLIWFPPWATNSTEFDLFVIHLCRCLRFHWRFFYFRLFVWVSVSSLCFVTFACCLLMREPERRERRKNDPITIRPDQKSQLDNNKKNNRNSVSQSNSMRARLFASNFRYPLNLYKHRNYPSFVFNLNKISQEVPIQVFILVTWSKQKNRIELCRFDLGLRASKSCRMIVKLIFKFRSLWGIKHWNWNWMLDWMWIWPKFIRFQSKIWNELFKLELDNVNIQRANNTRPHQSNIRFHFYLSSPFKSLLL